MAVGHRFSLRRNVCRLIRSTFLKSYIFKLLSRKGPQILSTNLRGYFDEKRLDEIFYERLFCGRTHSAVPLSPAFATSYIFKPLSRKGLQISQHSPSWRRYTFLSHFTTKSQISVRWIKNRSPLRTTFKNLYCNFVHTRVYASISCVGT